jgi:hypothetical protein
MGAVTRSRVGIGNKEHAQRYILRPSAARGEAGEELALNFRISAGYCHRLPFSWAQVSSIRQEPTQTSASGGIRLARAEERKLTGCATVTSRQATSGPSRCSSHQIQRSTSAWLMSSSLLVLFLDISNIDKD